MLVLPDELGLQGKRMDPVDVEEVLDLWRCFHVGLGVLEGDVDACNQRVPHQAPYMELVRPEDAGHLVHAGAKQGQVNVCGRGLHQNERRLLDQRDGGNQDDGNNHEREDWVEVVYPISFWSLPHDDRSNHYGDRPQEVPKPSNSAWRHT